MYQGGICRQFRNFRHGRYLIIPSVLPHVPFPAVEKNEAAVSIFSYFISAVLLAILTSRCNIGGGATLMF